MRVRLFRRFVFLVTMALLFFGALRGRADIQNPGRSTFPGDRKLSNRAQPPNAVRQTASVVEGGTVVIVLRARGNSGEMVDFVIRTPPAHGALEGDPRQLTLSTAQVTYTHQPGDNVGADSFTYAVQTRNSPLSAEATVTVRIQEPPPLLAVSPAELDFGAVKAGESTRAELTLTNQGGGEAAGRVDPPPPWVIDGNATYRLPRGASQTFALVFQPRREQAYTDALHFRFEAGGGVHLIGTGLAGAGEAPSAFGAVTVATAVPPAPAPHPGLVEDATAASLAPPSPTPVVKPASERPAVASLEPLLPPGVSSLPAAAVAVSGDSDIPGVNSLTVRGRSRSSLDLTWRVPEPAPKSYRVELRYLSLDADDKLIVQWRPYALTEFQTAHGFVNAHLSGLEADTLECMRIVAVDVTGRLAAPSPLLITYTSPAATWWRPTPLKVLFVLLILCGGLVMRRRWETNQILRSIDESRRVPVA